MKFCLPALRFLMGLTEGSHKDKNLSKFSMDDPIMDIKKNRAGGYAQISDCYVIYLLCYSIAGHSYIWKPNIYTDYR